MLRKTRRALGFEALEGKLLLSHGHSGVAQPPVHKSAPAQFSLLGVLTALPLPNNSAVSPAVTQFSSSGSLGVMGKVKGEFLLGQSFNYGHTPNLSNTTLTLSNKKGSVELLIAPSNSTTYNYVILSGTRSYAGAVGSGIAKLHFNKLEYGLVQVVLHSRAS
jgi:hypothetical protein